MSHNQLSDNSISMLAEALSEASTLTELFLTHNDLSQPSGVKIIKALTNKQALKSLALNSCKLNQNLLFELSEALKDNSENLKELYLYSNSIGPMQSDYIAAIIAKKRKLTCLGLSNNQIGEEGATILAEQGLQGKDQLTKLSLEGNFIGSQGLIAVSKALMSNIEL